MKGEHRLRLRIAVLVQADALVAYGEDLKRRDRHATDTSEVSALLADADLLLSVYPEGDNCVVHATDETPGPT